MNETKVISIEIEHRVKTIKEEVKNDFLFYNSATKKMEKYTCGNLTYVYDYETKTLKAQPQEFKISKTQVQDNESNILDFLDEYEEDFHITDVTVASGSVYFTIPEENLEELEDELEDRRYNYSIT